MPTLQRCGGARLLYSSQRHALENAGNSLQGLREYMQVALLACACLCRLHTCKKLSYESIKQPLGKSLKVMRNVDHGDVISLENIAPAAFEGRLVSEGTLNSGVPTQASTTFLLPRL